MTPIKFDLLQIVRVGYEFLNPYEDNNLMLTSVSSKRI